MTSLATGESTNEGTTSNSPVDLDEGNADSHAEEAMKGRNRRTLKNKKKESPFEKLNTLKLLYDCGHLTEDEYNVCVIYSIFHILQLSCRKEKIKSSTK